MRLLRWIPMTFVFLSSAAAQLAPNVSALAGSWEAKVPKHTDTLGFKLEIGGETQTGDCRVDIDEGWTLFLHEEDGALEGSATYSYMRSPKMAGVSAILCSNISNKFYMANYSVSLKRQGDKVAGVATPADCSIGPCPSKPQPLNATISMEGGKTIWMVDDIRKFELTVYQAK
jgi:hypothetical protein